MRQGGSLARTHEGEPGLPRGRSKLPPDTVRAAQRERLVRAVIAASASSGYASVTVGDVVQRAKVSRAAFYAHFTGKQDCFLAATHEGGRLMTDHVVAATRGAPATAEPEHRLRLACRAFLDFLASEPEFTRVFYVEMAAAGPVALERIDAARRRFAHLNRVWHERARATRPSWPAVPDEAYLAAVGGTTELVRAAVHRGDFRLLPRLENPVVALILALLAGTPWSAPPGPGAESPARASGAPLRVVPQPEPGRSRLAPS